MPKKSNKRLVLDEICQSFVETIDNGRFNGVVAISLKKLAKESEIKKALLSLVKDGSINCVFAEYEINIHIKRMPTLPIEKQTEFLLKTDLNEIGCYPTEREVRKRYDLESLNDRPYTKRLASGASQLDFVSFDFAALERYFNDPRFSFSFGDYL